MFLYIKRNRNTIQRPISQAGGGGYQRQERKGAIRVPNAAALAARAKTLNIGGRR
jgi:hypothetical protein